MSATGRKFSQCRDGLLKNTFLAKLFNSMHRLRALPGSSSVKLQKILRIETQKHTRFRRLRHHFLNIMCSSQPPIDEKAARETYKPPRISASGRQEVVTAFVRNASNNSILLVQRSEKVNMYKRYWGGVSGIVEGDENIQKRAETEVRYT